MAFARSFKTLYVIAESFISKLMHGHLLFEERKRELVGTCTVQRANRPQKQSQTKTNQPKNQTHQTKENTHRNDCLPVHWRIHAIGDNFVLSHLGMASNKNIKQKKKNTDTHTRPYPQVIDFFSSSLADVALKARSLHEHKLSKRRLYKDMKCPL